MNKDSRIKTLAWGEENFALPTVQGPKLRHDAEQPSCFDVREARIENDNLIQENQGLKQENETLNSRSSAQTDLNKNAKKSSIRAQTGKT